MIYIELKKHKQPWKEMELPLLLAFCFYRDPASEHWQIIEIFSPNNGTKFVSKSLWTSHRGLRKSE